MLQTQEHILVIVILPSVVISRTPLLPLISLVKVLANTFAFIGPAIHYFYVI